jgi:hypothetical protein
MPLHCGVVRSSSGIDPRHRRRIIAAAIGVGCEKEEGVGSFLLEKDEERERKEWSQGTMESIEIKSKRNIHMKRYQKHLQRKKEMTLTLGFSFGRFGFQKISLLYSVRFEK